MLKSYGIIKEVSSIISSAADDIAFKVLNDFEDLTGREEEITPQLRGEINRHLVESIQHKLGGRVINGCKFRVATFKKKQENFCGADLAGVIDFELNDKHISKAFLAQAKIGKIQHTRKGHRFAIVRSENILEQAEDMLKITSDSFFFIYSTEGIFCIPALQVLLAGSKTIDTKSYPFYSFGTFYKEFFKCFIGDHLISPSALGATSLEDYSEKIKAYVVFELSVSLESKKLD